ncbi:type II secretion system F family protein [Methanococcoides methylutens]|uniref:Transporter n=1 Tax=Methanococcoides methylutens MM1 TaxID=1434104 RepID=A0A0E3WZK2_METMT|nr:type II secretion system F family protein [Methanococcoides methylutens]AKB84930.1 Transporter [Methanococcoides methylutens MM1]
MKDRENTGTDEVDENIEMTTSDEVIESVDAADSGDIVESVDAADSGDIVESVDAADSDDIVESVDTADSDDIVESVDAADSGDIVESVDTTDSDEFTESNDIADPDNLEGSIEVSESNEFAEVGESQIAETIALDANGDPILIHEAEIPRMSEEELEKIEQYVINIRLGESRKNVRVKEFLSDPKGALYRYPYYAMFFSGPLALLFMAFGLSMTWGTPAIDHVILFSVWLFIIPPAITYHRKHKFIGKVEEYMPNFLRDIAEMSRAGLTLPAALGTVAKGEYGAMTGEIKKMDGSVSWGISFEETIEYFAKRMNTPLISRSVALITQASRAGGRVSFVLEAAARDASELKVLEKERRGNMAVYVVISYIAFFVFIFVILMLSTRFVPVMFEASQAVAGSGSAGGSFIGSFDPDNFIRVLYHASVIQGFMSGLVAGQLGESRISAGLKHSFILTFIAWVSFLIL